MDLILLFTVGINTDIDNDRKFVSHGSRIRSSEHDRENIRVLRNE